MRGLFRVLTLSLSKGEVGTMQDYPPVIGGKSATSSPARRGVDGPANFWLTATRMAGASFSASAKPGPRDRSHTSRPAPYVTPAGGATAPPTADARRGGEE